MKNTFKKLTAALFSAALAASLGMTSLPASYAADYTVTIDKPASDKATHTYEAYQVFAGDLHGTGDDAVLSNVVWGSGVNSAALLDELKNSSAFGTTSPFASCDSAQKVAEVIDKWENNGKDLQKFADIVSKHLVASKTISGAPGNNTLNMNAPGYYFIKDKDGSLDNQKDGAYTDYVLKVVDNVNIKAKEDVPAIAKKIVEGEALKDSNTASIGDDIHFQLDSTVPNMTAYNKYYYVINDTMCEGFDFQESSVKIYIDNMDNPINSNNYEVQTGTKADGYSFQIVMKNFKDNYKDKTGKPIKVTYTAKLNDKADRSEAGNENKVNLTYSNNPNHEYKGENEPSTTPGDGDVTGITPDSNTKTYTTSLLLIKTDGADGKLLEGAKFQLKGEKVNRVIIGNVDNFKKDDNGTYYKLKNGTFTLTAPTSETNDKYDSPTTKYKLVAPSTLHSGKEADAYVEAATDINGKITFAGLGAGTYTLTEIEAPSGYNKLANPINIVISANPTLEGPNWTVTKDGEELTKPTGVYEFTIENNMGVTLPSTGGMGTTVFYIVGGMLVAGALVLLIVKKRMNIKEK
ncbi:isopeptide-forming domain-containing fimbrial protein [uncultured Ruminococcus sp.]|uniref:isopeptide-forming domain-containing fimbrial protein n=1 Tax=uncultured Ruminococcus sp. TaxID=165186 RepID=UPI0025E8B042|nr:isopeptide-forming domain-containing fimbrial protein [uncultured Ruminococcus sp.]